MSSQFPKIPSVVEKNYFCGEDFDVMKRNSMDNVFGVDKKVFKYTSDRYVPARNQVRADFLQRNNEEDFDISLSANNVRTMKKVQYQNQLRAVFNEQKEDECKRKEDKAKSGEDASLLHLDWNCMLVGSREKFLPDFETLEKKNFSNIYSYIWSTNQIIAASSSRKVCLYHPMNGYTRALDINGRVALAFSTSGDQLAMAYRKSRRGFFEYDLYLFKMQQEALFRSEKLDTEKIRTTDINDDDITAMCYTQNDRFLMIGTSTGRIHALQNIRDASKRINKWVIFKTLTNRHKNEIYKICFSARYRYMASLDNKGEFKIWNGGSMTHIFSHQKEESKMYRHFEWHPFVENELIFGRIFYPALFLFNVTEKKVVAGFMNWKEDWELSSVAFNPITAQLAVCFYNQEEYINRVSILASMSQVICTFDFDYIEGGLKLFWNKMGTMLGAGAQSFRFAFWTFDKNRDFNMQMKGCLSNNDEKKTKQFLTLGDSKLNCIR